MHLYAETAKILKTIKDKRAALKSLVFSSRFHNKRKLYALVCETLRFCQTISCILERSKLPQKITNYEGKNYLLIVLAYEHFVGQGLDRSRGIAKLFNKHINVIEREYHKLLAERNASSLSDLLPEQQNAVSLPRYVRVNLLKTTVEKALDQFRKEGWKLKKRTKRSFEEDIESLGTREYLTDPHLCDVLVFPPGTEFHKHKKCIAGEIILQDKASCFPAHVLNPPEGSVVIDCCAAPGNKTSHVASLLHNTGQIYAFDKNAGRLKTMQKMLSIAGVTNTESTCQDFLTVDPSEEKYAGVQYIIVDPSCSGSGIVGRLNHLVDEKQSCESRLQSLANFQATVLKHALSFPNVKRVVYSTCSIHAQENEAVVEEVLQQVEGDFKLKNIFPDWSNRGVKGYEPAQMCLRMSPDQDFTNGFFVACFERKGKGISEDPILANGHEENEECEMSGLTRREKKKLKKLAKKRKLREEKSLKLDNHDCVTKNKKAKSISDFSYKITEKPKVVRVDNSSHVSRRVQTLFKTSHSGRDRLVSVRNGIVWMLRKWKIDYTIKDKKKCCIVECSTLNKRKSSNAGIASKKVSGRTERILPESSVRDPCNNAGIGRVLTKAEKRKLKKKRRKLNLKKTVDSLNEV